MKEKLAEEESRIRKKLMTYFNHADMTEWDKINAAYAWGVSVGHARARDFLDQEGYLVVKKDSHQLKSEPCMCAECKKNLEKAADKLADKVRAAITGESR